MSGFSSHSSRLAGRSVLIIGMGALGCAAARLLARSNLGHLTLLDPDSVETSNLQRQVLFDENTLGKAKAPAAAEALASDPKIGSCHLEPIVGRFEADNAYDLATRHDFLIDASDDPATKYLTNDVAVATYTPYCHGGVIATRGQLMSVDPGRSACLACVFPPAPDTEAGAAGGCAAQGILAPVAGVVGSLQAREALLCLNGHRDFRPGRMMIYEMYRRRWQTIIFPKNPNCGCCATRDRAEAPRRQPTCLL